jgi:hypothetical protein
MKPAHRRTFVRLGHMLPPISRSRRHRLKGLCTCFGINSRPTLGERAKTFAGKQKPSRPS